MKRITYLLFLLLLTLNGWAQDFKPGGQTQNLTEQKNVLVDYSTGIFNYKVPLYKLRSGNYELPVSLDYIGKGVKDSDSPGLLGYNWMLNAGGIVTRTMRGGFPDEDTFFGYLQSESNSTPLQDDAKNVGLRKRDGESDIFTAVFNGQKVDFIIRVDKNRKIYAEPLEQTDVRIECEHTSGKITGWIVTDNNGDRYIYRQVEMNTNVRHVDVSTVNAISHNAYNSAWHLSRILPYNGAPIEFCYKGSVENTGPGSTGKISNQEIRDSYTMTYYYGKPMKEQPFDYKKYQAEITEDIETAQYHLEACSQEALLKEVDAQMVMFTKYGQGFFQPLENTIVKNNNRLIGILANIKEMTSASLQLENTLTSLSKYCDQLSDSYNGRLAGMHLKVAANSVHNCLIEIRTITQKEIAGGSCYDILSPLPYMIITPERIIKFTYTEYTTAPYLSEIKLYNRDETLLSSVSLTQDATCLKKVSFYGKENKETGNMKFGYYNFSDFPTPPNGIESDLWGYCRARNTSGKEYEMLTALHSLKSITLADGGKIGIEYEKNRTSAYNDYGGIRLKTLLFDNGNNRNDTISYSYPSPGKSMYSSWSNAVNVCYSGFCDQIIYDRVRPKGYLITNMGNNGLYYPQVTETIHGKGYNAYHYRIADPISNVNYPFWAAGLLSEKEVYDADGNLLQTTQYKYKILSDYNSALPQMQPSDYYLDGNALKIYYNSQTTDYVKGNEMYQHNIEPRLSPNNASGFYYLRYGGRTVLEEEVEYRLDKDTPYRRTDYYYDNPKSMFPTRTVSTGSNGQVLTKVCKRVTDMADGVDLVIDKMKQKNLLSPIVKESTLSEGKLINETVWKYQEEASGKNLILPTEAFMYVPETSVVCQTAEKETALFNYGEDNYFSSVTLHYGTNKTSTMPVEENGRIQKKSYAYDNFGNLLLECNTRQGSARDLYKNTEGGNINREDIITAITGLQGAYMFCKRILQVIPNEVDDYHFLGFLDSHEHHFIIRFAEEMASKNIDLTEAQNCFEAISENEKRILNIFKQEYTQFIRQYPKYQALQQFVAAMEKIIACDGQKLFEYLHLIKYEIEKPTNSNYSVTLNSLYGAGQLKLYILSEENDVSVYVTHANGRTEHAVESEDRSSLKVYDIDLGAYTGVTEVTASSQGKYMALVPEGATFNATSYNADGAVYAKFDQEGKVEFYTYDKAGRVTQIKDRLGNILKEYKYNRIINQ